MVIRCSFLRMKAVVISSIPNVRQAESLVRLLPMPGIINSSFEEKSVTLSHDEKTLYFSSNRPGGFGGLDIYRATKDSKGEWTNVKNLGPNINTDMDDDGPFIDYDGVTLYFSSKGRKGMGGFDVFKTTFDPEDERME